MQSMYNAMIVEVQENGMFIEMVPGGVIVFLPSFTPEQVH